MGVLRSAALRRAESRFWGVFIIAVHRASVLGWGARHRGIVELSKGSFRCVTVSACFTYLLTFAGGLCNLRELGGERGRNGKSVCNDAVPVRGCTGSLRSLAFGQV